MKKAIYLILTMALSTSVMAEVTVPNTFVSGTAAVAAEVNDNFTTVANGVNDNATGIAGNTVATVSNGSAIVVNASAIVDNAADVATNTQAVNDVSLSVDTNTFNVGVNADGVATNTNAIATIETSVSNIQTTKQMYVYRSDGTEVGVQVYRSSTEVSPITSNGYMYESLSYSTGAPRDVYLMYTEAGCNGTAYVISGTGGRIFRNTSNIMYTELNAMPVLMTPITEKDLIGQCITSTRVNVNGVVALPIDYAVTGAVQTSSFVPFTFEYK